jgi:lysozyme family protein
MADVTIAVNALLEAEGWFIYYSDDHGRATKYGITSRSYPQLDIATLTKTDAIRIYERDFWHPNWYALSSQLLANALLKASAFHGLTAAVQQFQSGLATLGSSAPVDGLFGAKTLWLANQLDPTTVLRAFRTEQILRCVELCETHATQRTSLRGWISRILTSIVAVGLWAWAPLPSSAQLVGPEGDALAATLRAEVLPRFLNCPGQMNGIASIDTFESPESPRVRVWVVTVVRTVLAPDAPGGLAVMEETLTIEAAPGLVPRVVAVSDLTPWRE